jgi:putative acetyltransferase
MIAIRQATDDDGYDLAALLGAVFSEYDGAVFAISELPELRCIASSFARARGEFWVAERQLGGKPIVVGCSGFTKAGLGIELRKLYVAKSERKTGLGSLLLERVEAAARAQSSEFIELWSDTRFVTAHQFYEKRGYRRHSSTRDLNDASGTVEYYFRKAMVPDSDETKA